MPRKDPKSRDEYNQQYREAHREENSVYCKERYQKNKERIRAQQKEYYAENREAINARSKANRDPEDNRQKAREYRANNLEKCREKSREYHRTHREQLLEYGKEYRARTKEQRRRNRLLQEYDLTPEQVTEMAEIQNNLCAACGVSFLGEKPAIDHNHTTGRVRGLVHMKCNLGIGHFDDSPAKLRAAADYLERLDTQA